MLRESYEKSSSLTRLHAFRPPRRPARAPTATHRREGAAGTWRACQVAGVQTHNDQRRRIEKSPSSFRQPDPSLSALSFLHQIYYYEAIFLPKRPITHSLATPPKSRISMVSSQRLYSGALHARLRLDST
ncbi:hypothetical protein EVAR_53430_1 [Eumeta japonica]|uniref:Uncharacterized protein n=1 Tax=Eumeta variegata TaxID=151549 RepID=A0A4C1Y1U2_EUMVA|nr:hypothetical protein EVAR_53430_1 [Eumeta japonica]